MCCIATDCDGLRLYNTFLNPYAMKKLFYLLMLVVPLGFMASCADDENLPDVDIAVTLDNASYYEGVVYVPQSENLEVEEITVRAIDGSPAALANLRYYWDGVFQPGLTFGVYPMALATEGMPDGRHSLALQCTVLEVNKSLAWADLYYPVVIISDETQLPAGAPMPGQVTLTSRLNMRD